nr:Tm-1-like ATP-binding domain-containing protein [uncultured Oscillibacter sp.]
MQTIAIIGTFDTKGAEFKYIKTLIEEQGFRTFCIHTGVFKPLFKPDVSNEEIAAAAGADIQEIVVRKDRARATEVLARGLEILLPQLFDQERFSGVISVGGSGGTSLATPAMRALPVGVPKVMVSTMASGDVSPYVGTSDIIMIPSVVDAEGLNEISMRIFSNAANAIAGMVSRYREIPKSGRPLLAATMFGVTTPCVKAAKDYLEQQGYDVLVFHATGTGGRSMEALIEGGFIRGVLDLTTTEWCDELYGGVLDAGPHRLEAAGRKGIPQVVSVGAMDMVNFGPWESVPERYKGRNLYRHNPTVTLMRTTEEENVGLGQILAEKLNMAKGKTALLLPLKGVSAIDTEGQPFYGPKEDRALFRTLRETIGSQVELVELDLHINDEAFALAAAQKLTDLLQAP